MKLFCGKTMVIKKICIEKTTRKHKRGGEGGQQGVVMDHTFTFFWDPSFTSWYQYQQQTDIVIICFISLVPILIVLVSVRQTKVSRDIYKS